MLKRRWWALFAALFSGLVLLPLLRAVVFVPGSMGVAETVFFWFYFVPPGVVFGGGSWDERSLFIGSAVFYTLVSAALASGILWVRDRRARGAG